MKSICILIFALSFFYSCNNHENKHVTNKKNIINKDTCLDGFILIEYMGEVDHSVKSLLIRTNKKDTAFTKYIADKSVIHSNFRKFDLNEIISTKNEFEILKNYITTHNTQKKKTCVDNGVNTQLITLLDKCDTLYYVVDRTDTLYFKNLEDIVKDNKTLRKYFEYSRRIQERRLEDRYNYPR